VTPRVAESDRYGARAGTPETSVSDPRRDPPPPAEAAAIWRVCEAIDAVTVVAAEVRDALRSTGLRGLWTGLIASRIAPLGPIGPEVATAVLHDLAPRRVASVLPDAWAEASPTAVLAARTAALPVALERFTGATPPEAWQTATDHLARAVAAADAGGRPLFAAHRGLPSPDDPLARLWQAASATCEHRREGRVAALTAGGLDGLEGHVLTTAVQRTDPAVLREDRGWTLDDWDAATVALADRGLVDRTGVATPTGERLHAAIEDVADRAAARPLAALTSAERSAMIGSLAGIAQRIAASGPVPFPRLGAPRP
jgi:hypothetical protein